MSVNIGDLLMVRGDHAWENVYGMRQKISNGQVLVVAEVRSASDVIFSVKGIDTSFYDDTKSERGWFINITELMKE